MHKILFSFFCTFILFSTLHATLIMTDNVQKNEDFIIKYFYDESSLLEITDIENTNFIQTIPSQFTQGYKDANAWFKIELENSSKNEDFVLYFTESIWSTVDLYTKQNARWEVQKNGLNIPLNERGIKDVSAAFNIHLKSGESAVLYVKGKTISGQIGEFQLFTKNEFFNPTRMTITQWYIIYAFVLSVFIVLNFYNFLITKESIYIYYIGYLSIYIVFSCMHSGVYISLGFTNWEEGLHVLGQLTLFGLLQFSKKFLNLETTYPSMEKIFNYLSIVALIIAVLISQNVPYSTIGSNLYFSAALIIMIYVAVKVLKHGFQGAKYYLIALMLYLPSMAMMAMDFNAVLENNDITRYSFLGGAFVEMLLFTLILTNRYLVVKQEVYVKTEELNVLNKTLQDDIQTQLGQIREKDGQLLEQARLASMGEMVGNIAHQWRQPLNALGLILQKIPLLHQRNMLDEKILQTTVDKGMKLIQQMSKTIDDFRYFFQEDKKAESFKLLETVDNCHALLSTTLEHENIELQITVNDAIMVHSHANELLQVLLNIINNAKDALISNAIENALISVSARFENNTIVIDISDNAGGIPKDIINKVFEPYFTTKEDGKGTGIGLFMSKRIIEENMQGKLTVSNTDIGAKFSITLPLTCAL